MSSTRTFDEAFESIPGSGWLSRAEAELLWQHAKGSTGGILEVGCYKGRSTCLLAQLGRVVCVVDSFCGFDSDDPSGAKTLAAFNANLAERRISVAELAPGPKYPVSKFLTDEAGVVLLYRQRVEEWLPRSIGFAYLDGDHTYEGTKAQLRAALQCSAKKIAVHDVNDSGDGVAIKRACLEELGPWDERVERLAVWVR